MERLEDRTKRHIVETLKLEKNSADEIDIDEPLFVDGLGLDSIDALELGVAIRKNYDIKIESASGEIKEHFANVRSLARFVETHSAG